MNGSNQSVKKNRSKVLSSRVVDGILVISFAVHQIQLASGRSYAVRTCMKIGHGGGDIGYVLRRFRERTSLVRKERIVEKRSDSLTVNVSKDSPKSPVPTTISVRAWKNLRMAELRALVQTRRSQLRRFQHRINDEGGWRQDVQKTVDSDFLLQHVWTGIRTAGLDEDNIS